MEATMSLVDRLRTDSHRGFVSRPRYYAHGDYLTYFIDPARCHARRISSLVTVYTAVEDGGLVGIKIKGVERLMKTLEAFFFTASDGKVSLGMLLLSAAVIEKESTEQLKELSKKFGNAPVPLGHMCDQAA
jgi:hypothetical protein